MGDPDHRLDPGCHMEVLRYVLSECFSIFLKFFTGTVLTQPSKEIIVILAEKYTQYTTISEMSDLQLVGKLLTRQFYIHMCILVRAT